MILRRHPGAPALQKRMQQPMMMGFILSADVFGSGCGGGLPSQLRSADKRDKEAARNGAHQRGGPVGQPGELVVQGESFAKFYWNKPEKTASAWTKDGWFRSGDTMHRDQDGYFFFCGRGDDMLKVGGIWVAPFEIESALAAHPAVIEAAVIGAPDETS